MRNNEAEMTIHIENNKQTLQQINGEVRITSELQAHAYNSLKD